MTKTRKLLLAGAAAVGVLMWAGPAKADLSGGDLKDILEAPGGILEILEFIITEATGIPRTQVHATLYGLFGQVGRAPRSYLPDGADTYEMFPVDPNWPTPGDVKWRVDQGYEDARSRVEESMAVASDVVRTAPVTGTRLEALEALSMTPEGMLAVDQVNASATIEVAKAVNQQNLLLAELGQIEADQHMTKAFASKQAQEYAKYHYKSYSGQPLAYGEGSVTFQPRPFRPSW